MKKSLVRIALAAPFLFGALFAQPVQAGEGCPDGSFVQLLRVDPVGNDRKSGRRLKRVIEEIDGTTRCNRALVTIGAGRYRLEEPIRIPPHVDISGEGEYATRLVGDESPFGSLFFLKDAFGKPFVVEQIRLKSLSYTRGGDLFGEAFVGTLRDVTLLGPFFTDYGDVIMRRVTALERDGDYDVGFGGYGAKLREVVVRGPGMAFTGGPISLTDVRVTSISQEGDESIAVSTLDADIEMDNVKITAIGSEGIGISNYALGGGTLRVDDSRIEAATHTLQSGSDFWANATQRNYVTDTKLIGGSVEDEPDSVTECTNVIDENNATYNGTCP